jgi:hypothetical protein
MLEVVEKILINNTLSLRLGSKFEVDALDRPAIPVGVVDRSSLKATPATTLDPIEEGRTHFLLVADEPDRIKKLELAFVHDAVRLTKALTAEELAQSCRWRHDLAIVDVGKEHLVEVLKALRESKNHAGILILVEGSRLPYDQSLAGVLPTYRAMPASHDDIIHLAHCRLKSPPQSQLIGRSSYVL